ncbi:MAG: OmpA family protein [Magnetococcales bacterium]|nr:OmpA family protein [Magnetococcales bacterium]
MIARRGTLPAARWLRLSALACAGVVLVLFCCMVLLFSVSHVSRARFDKAAESVRLALSGRRAAPAPLLSPAEMPEGDRAFQQEVGLVRLREKIGILLSGLVDQGDVELADLQQGVMVRIDNRVLFEGGSVLLRDAIKPQLQQLAALLSGVANPVRIVGHTDDQGAGGEGVLRDNWSFSAVRAAAFVHFLTSEGGVTPRRLQAVGQGHSLPRSDNGTEAGRAKNRRTELFILRQGVH